MTTSTESAAQGSADASARRGRMSVWRRQRDQAIQVGDRVGGVGDEVGRRLGGQIGGERIGPHWVDERIRGDPLSPGHGRDESASAGLLALTRLPVAEPLLLEQRGSRTRGWTIAPAALNVDL